MIPSMRIKNFKCFRDFGIELDPFTVLVGPNGSGKTAFMQAIRCMAAVGPKGVAGWGVIGPIVGGGTCAWRNDLDAGALIAVPDRASAAAGEQSASYELRLKGGEPTLRRLVQAGKADGSGGAAGGERWLDAVIGQVAYYKLSPPSLKEVAQRQVGDNRLGIEGEGLPQFLHALILGDRRAFAHMESVFYERFPEYSSILLHQVPGSANAYRLEFETRHGVRLPVTAVSDGAVLSLAYLAIAYHPEPPNILLIEEPENGVHHAKLREIVDTLKLLPEQKNVQVILTTHSPYLLDLVEPENVRVFTKDEEGAATAIRMSDVPDVESWRKDFMSGEIWTSLPEKEMAAKAKGPA